MRVVHPLAASGLAVFVSCAVWPSSPEEIRSSDLRDHLEFFASEDLVGRQTDQPGAREAALYIAQSYGRAGLLAGGANGTYFQPFPAVVGYKIAPESYLMIAGYPFSLGDQFTVASSSGVASAGGEMIFAGYGITAPEFRRNDYAGIDARGKIVLAFTGAPGVADGTGPFAGEPGLAYTRVSQKQAMAEAQQAAGLVLVQSPLEFGDAMFAEALPDYSSGTARPGLPTVVVTPSAMTSIFKDWNLSLDDLDARLNQGETTSQSLPSAARMGVLTSPVTAEANNVIGVLPGRFDNTILVSAPYDAPPDEEQAAASDLAVLLETAEAVRNRQFLHTIVFVAFGAERLGGFGSRQYAKQPFSSLNDTDAAIHLNCYSSSDSPVTTTGPAEFDRFLQQAIPKLVLELDSSTAIDSAVGKSTPVPLHNIPTVVIRPESVGPDPTEEQLVTVSNFARLTLGILQATDSQVASGRDFSSEDS